MQILFVENCNVCLLNSVQISSHNSDINNKKNIYLLPILPIHITQLQLVVTTLLRGGGGLALRLVIYYQK